MDLGIVDDELATCVACGLCLPHCPTYRVTGEEALSPRGRVAAMRQVQWDGAAIDASFVHSITTCVQCRGCETACPSGVPFGHLVEAARAALAEGTASTAGPRPARDASGGAPADAGGPSRPAPGTAPARGPTPAERGAARAGRPSPGLRLALRSLRWHRLVLAGSSLLAVAQRLRLVPRALGARLGLPARLPVRRPRLRATPPRAGATEDVWLFTGCVMDAWLRDVHVDVQRVVEAAGGRVAFPGPAGACCGALAHHAGMAGEARARAVRTMAAFPGDAPILVDAAGCGAMLEDYGRLLGTPEAERFGDRVRDVHEWLAERIDVLTAAAPPAGAAPRPAVAVQDPCHLRHVQRAHVPVRTVLGPFADVVELDDDGLCCGAGGAYAAVQPVLASAIRDRKLAAIARSGAPVVASANPGCALHLAAGGVEAVHPCQVVARALDTAADGGS
jgi:glycolate oxidase iron-sulfur subunit